MAAGGLAGPFDGFLHDESHVPFVRKFGLLSQPEGVVYGEGVYRHGQALGVDFGELFPSRVVFEEAVVHVVGDLLRPRPVDLVYFLRVWVVSVQSPELALDVAEEEEEVGAVAPVDHVQHPVASLGVHHAGEHNVLDGVQDDRAVGLARRLAVQPRA